MSIAYTEKSYWFVEYNVKTSTFNKRRLLTHTEVADYNHRYAELGWNVRWLPETRVAETRY